MYRYALKATVLGSTLMFITAGSAPASDEGQISFNMVVSPGAKACLPNAQAEVRVISSGTAEDMYIEANGLPPNTDFDFFVIQVPNAPFGLSWYQGDVQTN